MTSAVRQRRPALVAVPESQHAVRHVARGGAGLGSPRVRAAGPPGPRRRTTARLERPRRNHPGRSGGRGGVHARARPPARGQTPPPRRGHAAVAAADRGRVAAGRERRAGLVQPGPQGHRPRRPVGRPVRPVGRAVGGRARPARHPGLRAGRRRAARGRGRISPTTSARSRTSSSSETAPERSPHSPATSPTRQPRARRARFSPPRATSSGSTIAASGSSSRASGRRSGTRCARCSRSRRSLSLADVDEGLRRVVPAGQASAGRAAAGL